MRLLKILYIVSLLFMYSCKLPVPSFEPEKKVIKQFQNDSFLLEWYTYSGNQSQQFPNYVTISTNKKTDTICIADNVADLKFKNNEITVGFFGRPQKAMDLVALPDFVFDYAIFVDTSYTYNTKH